MARNLRPTEAEAAVLIARMNRVAGRAGAIVEVPAIAPKKTRRRSAPSELEIAFATQLSVLELPPPQREYRFMDKRDWRLDYAWPQKKLAVEVQGMVHRIKERFLRDVEKLAYAQIYGWQVLLLAGDDVRSGRGVSWLVTLWEMKTRGKGE